MVSCAQRTAVAVLLSLPVAIAFIFITLYGVNVVFWDQWDFLPLFDKLYAGNLTFSDLIAQNNEHRFLVYRLIMITLGGVTHYNNLAEMYLSWVVLCLICWVLYKIFTIGVRPSWTTAAWFVPVPWLMFNLRQFENLLFGIQVAFYMLILCFLLSVYLLQTGKGLGWKFWAAVACGITGTFSVASGLLIWLIGALQLIALYLCRPRAEKASYLRPMLVWIVIAAGLYLFYFWGYEKPPWHPSLLYFTEQPLVSISYGLAALGCVFSINTVTAIIAGLVLAVLYLISAIIIFRDLKGGVRYLPYLALAVFTVASVLLLVLGRSGFGVEQALSSRYISITVLGIIGIYMLIVTMPLKLINLKSWRLRTAITLLMLFLFSLNMYILLIPGQTYLNRQMARQYLITYDVQPDENLKYLYPDPDRLKKYIPILIKYKLNVFSETGRD